MWYVWVIIATYIVFYLVFKYLSKPVSIVAFDIIVLAYCILSSLINPREQMYASIIGLCAGVHFANESEKLIARINENYVVNTFCIGISFLLFFFFRLLISKMGFENTVCQTILRNIITLLFVGFILCINVKLKIKGKIVRKLGGISYEIYLIHPFVLYTIDEICAKIKPGYYNFLVIVGTIIITLVLSAALKILCARIFKKTASKRQDIRKDGNNNVRAETE